MNPLHMIFDLKGVIVGKDYFKINHLLPLLFNLTQECYSKAKFKRIPFKVFRAIYHLHMDICSTWQDEYSLEKNKKKYKY